MKYIPAENYCSSVRDGTHDTPQPVAKGYKLVTGKHIKNGRIDYSDAYCISAEDFGAINARSLVEQWDVLMSMIGTVGEAAVVSERPQFAIKNVALFKCDGSETKGKWLAYYLNSKMAKDMMSGNMKGASQQFLSLKQLRALPIPIVAESVMDKVVGILSAYDDLIENNRKQIKLLEEAAQRLYKEWFIDLRFPGHEHTPIINGIPEGWKKTLFADLIEIKYGKDHKGIAEGNIPVYGSGGLMRKCCKALHVGEAVLIPRKGSLNNIMYVDGPFWTVDTMFYALMKQPHLGFLIYFFLRSIDMYSLDIGAAVPSMTTSILNSLEIPLPTPSVLEKFDTAVYVLFQQVSTLNDQSEMLMESRDRHMHKLLARWH